MSTETITTFISTAAAKGRINRALAKQGQNLCTSRAARAKQELGKHFLVDMRTNSVVAAHVDVDTLGKELGVIKPWELVI